MHEQKIAVIKYLVGIDVGSTTTKIVVLDSVTNEIIYSDYERHNAKQYDSVKNALELLQKKFPKEQLRVSFTGSGAKPIAECLGVPFIQEVVANALFLREQYDDVGTAIELGGQDAKMIFFHKEGANGKLSVADMRMNGSCAGGTGAFLDEIAVLLKVPAGELETLAESGNCVYDISGRCGVYAKTDIQPLLNQGVAKSDIALSAFHAIAKQTIGGLAQGLDIGSPVVFEGGPFHFHPALVRVFAERLGLKSGDILIPEHPETVIAHGAAISLKEMFADSKPFLIKELIILLDEAKGQEEIGTREQSKPFFDNETEKEEFRKRHEIQMPAFRMPEAGTVLQVYLGIDSGSTTTKFVLMDEKENIFDSFYAHNEGDPLTVAREALVRLRDRYRENGVELDILGVGTTGYGEMLFSKALHTEYHVVETVAHARAASRFAEDATFILDIGGQDMKAIWLDHGIITNIVVNEACSSGCGSFLENFAAALQIPVNRIAETAFSSQEPAVLGSRCTVFMNSSIITEQRSGKRPEDIMAGLCRSIIENVFTKVIRVSNLDSLGDRIIVQGGTFRNDAVLRAMEQYLGKEVIRAPYAELMGAIGAALLAKEHCGHSDKRTFIGLDNLEKFTYTQEADIPCPFCQNHCKRTVLRFSDGSAWVTNNRCERGGILGDPKDAGVKSRLREQKLIKSKTANLFRLREQLLFQEYPYPQPAMEREIMIGLPRVLSYYETMPFWSTFWRTLGFEVLISPPSSRRIYESGLAAVASDTICFPAKLVHGHIRSLAEEGVDRIFMPSVATVASENKESTSESMCAVVKGYPIVMKNSDNPEKRWNVPFDTPLFYWYQKEDRDRQLVQYMEDTFGISADVVHEAIKAGDKAQGQFEDELQKAGQAVLEEVEKNGTYAVVLASRPYQNDPLVNHDLPEMFVKMGIPVLTVDSLPGINEVDLSKSRLDIVNNFHARMLSSAVLAAENEHLEYVQIVSFGCGHDAYLSDEIVRLMGEISGKAPLILKLDESDIQGPLRIRVRSFVETISMRRAEKEKRQVHSLPDPYPVKFTKKNRKEKVVLVPNTSHAFCRIMSAVLCRQHIRAVPLEVGREDAIRLGKKYVHNDVCFPAQIVVGEILAALRSGVYDLQNVAVCMAKYIGDCRLTHYSAFLRKALDDAGYSQVPILTNDDMDYHNLHPGFKMNLLSQMRIAFTLPMIDALEELLRKIRPYEKVKGATNEAFDKGMDLLVDGLEHHGIPGAKRGFSRALALMDQISYDQTEQKPQALIVGEYLLNFHPGANHDIEEYLEQNGFEVIEAHMTDVIHKTYFCQDAQIKEYHVKKPFYQKLFYRMADEIFNFAHKMTDKATGRYPFCTPACRLKDLVKDSDPVIYHTFDAGEGILIPGEILHYAKEGCRAFIILQPFGCLPNHVVGRGVTKKLKEMYPDAQILPLDYDPDVSLANIENRLQMMIMNVKASLT